jgi:hypothetical protein
VIGRHVATARVRLADGLELTASSAELRAAIQTALVSSGHKKSISQNARLMLKIFPRSVFKKKFSKGRPINFG